MKSILKWYRLAKYGTGLQRYVKSVQGQESREAAVQAEDWFSWVAGG